MVETKRDFSSDSYILFEHYLSIPGLNKCLFVILGECSSGLFTAIPELGISCNLSRHDFDTSFNEKQLIECGLNPTSASELSLYIENWIRCNSKFMEELRTKNFDLLCRRISMLHRNDMSED